MNENEHEELQWRELQQDDMSPALRACRNAGRPDSTHNRAQCPDCLESEADNVKMDADSHLTDGDIITATALDVEAAALRARAAALRK